MYTSHLTYFILCAILQSHHLDKFYQQPRLLLGQGCSVVQSNLSLCQYVKTPIFSLVMPLLVQKLLLLHSIWLVVPGSFPRNLLHQIMRGGTKSSDINCNIMVSQGIILSFMV